MSYMCICIMNYICIMFGFLEERLRRANLTANLQRYAKMMNISTNINDKQQ